MKKIYIVDFLTSLCFVSNVMNLYFQYIGYNFTQIGILFAILQLSKFLFEMPTGFVADKYGRKTSLIIGIILQLVCYIIMGTTTNFYFQLSAMILLGCSYTFSTGTTSAILVEMCENEHKDLLHVTTISWYIYYIAFGISSILSGILISYSFSFIFILNILSILSALFILMLLNSDVVSKKEEHFSGKELVLYLISNKMLYYFILVSFITDFVMMPVDSFYNNYLYTYFKFSYTSIGIIIALQYILQGVVVYFSERVIIIFDKSIVIKYFPFNTILIFFVFSMLDSPYLSVAIYIFGWMFFSLYIPVFDAEKQKYIVSKYRSSALSFESLLTAFGACFTKLLYGFLSDKIGIKYTTISFIFFAALALLGVVSYYSKRIMIERSE